MLLDGWFENQFASLRVLIASPARIFMQRKYLKPVLRISTASSLDLGQHQIWALHAALFGTGKIHHSNGPPKNTLKPSKTDIVPWIPIININHY